MGARQITRKGLAHLWSFVELDRAMTPAQREKDEMSIRLTIAFSFMKFILDRGREPRAIVVSRRTYDVLTRLEEDKVLYGHTTPIVVLDGIPDGVGVLAE